MKAMQRRDYEQPNTVSKKVANEQQAIASQVRRYKQNYMNKVIQANNLQTFIKFSKQLFLLLISHCKNILCVAPENVSNGLEEISVFFDDIINKYYQAALKLNDRFAETHKSEGKLSFISELCAVCSQQIKKVEIDQTRRSIFNESLTVEKENCDEKKEEDDLKFFADLNDLLNHSHGELLKNQIEIDIYQDVALNAIKSLSSLKNYFSRDSVVLPSNSWIEQAQAQMKKLLKENFNGKIPAWIEKMFMMFWSLHRKEAFSRQKEEGVQTISNTNSEILELKKKIHRSIEKLEKTESRIQIQDHEMVSMTFEKKDLEIRVDYYKKELNKLIDEIEAIKSENQSIKLRLTSNCGGKESQSASKTQLSYYERENTIRQSSRSHQRATHRDQLPKIERSSFVKRAKKRESLTSIKIMQSQAKSERDSTSNRPQKLSFTQQQSSFNDQTCNSNPEPGTPAGIREYHNDFKDRVIQEEQGETLLEDEKRRIEEVNRHIKQMVKNKFQKNGLKRYFSNTFDSDKIKNSLKRIPRRTNKMQPTLRDSDDKRLEKQSIYSGDCKQLEETSKTEKINTILMKIYNYLKDQGFLIRLTEEQFKQSIRKINELDVSILASDDCQRTLENRLTMGNNTMDRLSFNRKAWNEETFHISKEETERNTKLQEKSYFSIFTNQENAFNYEVSLTKNHFKGIYKMSKPQEKICEQFYEIITSIKMKNFNHYKFICSYLRYPFQVMKNDFGVVNIVNQMKYENFHQYFQRLMGIHTKCKKEDGLCMHFEEFKTNLLKKV